MDETVKSRLCFPWLESSNFDQLAWNSCWNHRSYFFTSLFSFRGKIANCLLIWVLSVAPAFTCNKFRFFLIRINFLKFSSLVNFFLLILQRKLLYEKLTSLRSSVCLVMSLLHALVLLMLLLVVRIHLDRADGLEIRVLPLGPTLTMLSLDSAIVKPKKNTI